MARAGYGLELEKITSSQCPPSPMPDVEDIDLLGLLQHAIDDAIYVRLATV